MLFLEINMNLCFQLLKMTFGDWEMFKVMVIILREQEITSVLRQDEIRPIKLLKPVERRSKCFMLKLTLLQLQVIQ